MDRPQILEFHPKVVPADGMRQAGASRTVPRADALVENPAPVGEELHFYTCDTVRDPSVYHDDTSLLTVPFFVSSVKGGSNLFN